MFAEFPLEGLENRPTELKNLLAQNTIAIQELLTQEPLTYQNFVVPYQALTLKINEFFTPISLLDSVHNSETTQAVMSDCLVQLSAYQSKLGANEEVYEAFLQIQKSEGESLTQEQKQVVENEIRDFKLGGCGLTKEQKARLEEINLRLSQIGKDYTQNILNDTNAWEMIIENPEDVREISESDLAHARFTDATGREKYRFTLHMPSYIAYMTYGSNRSRREEMYKASNSRAFQNGKLVEEISHLRQEKAQMLGFENYSQLSLITKMAPTEEAVIELLETLAHLSKDAAKQDIKDLQPLALNDGIEEIQVWDLMYYTRKLKESTYAIDEEYYRPYFEKHHVLEGLFKFLNRMFRVTFTPVDTPTWHDNVSVYDVSHQERIIGRLYLDLEARKGKKDGAWMSNWHAHSVINGEETLATAFVVGNFPPSSEKGPSLLRHYDVQTLFHEMGHALHHLLSTVKEPFVSGVNGVAWDVVEFPSQFLDKFAYAPEVLKLFAKHHETGEILSDEAIEKLDRARNFQSSLKTITQVEYALFDFLLHQKKHSESETQELIDSIREDVSPLIPPAYSKLQHRFMHIFAGGYAAGYYSYKWAEVLSADAYLLFQENGIIDTDLAQKYYEFVLSKGGSKDMTELYRDFAGRDPEVESLLKLDGII